jgi:LysM repeat protein
MNSNGESNILRVLAVSALAVAVVVVIMITTNSGILGDDEENNGNDSVEPSETPAVVDPAAEVPEAAPAEETEAAPVEDDEPITLETETYVIEGGDSFYSISIRFDTTIDELGRLNPAVNPQNLSPGTELVVPKGEAAEE